MIIHGQVDVNQGEQQICVHLHRGLTNLDRNIQFGHTKGQ